MMMSGRAAQPLALRASTIFYYLGTPFVVVNTICVLVSIGTLVPPLLCRDGSPECAQLANTWNWWGVAAMASFSLVLALAAVGAGTAVSCKIRDIASVEPALRPFAYAKLVKVALAAIVFWSCLLARACVLGWLLVGRPVGLGVFFACAILLPELLPTTAALLVLRRRACPPTTDWLTCCLGRGVGLEDSGSSTYGSRRPGEVGDSATYRRL